MFFASKYLEGAFLNTNFFLLYKNKALGLKKIIITISWFLRKEKLENDSDILAVTVIGCYCFDIISWKISSELLSQAFPD